jgi:hypothetical protein
MVKKYKRKNSNQYLITLKQGHPFNENEPVYIISKTEFDKSNVDNISHENIISNLKTENDKLQTEIKELMEYKIKSQDLQDKHDKLLYQIISLERLNKNYLVALTKMEGLSFMNRLFNRVPKDIKALTDGSENIDKKG